jgi:hypothetical protein
MLREEETDCMAGTRPLRELVFALGIVLLGSSAAGAEAGWTGWIDLGLGRLVTPGVLARAHADLEGVSGCTSCHGGLEGTPDHRCSGCHMDVKERMDEGIGAHGGFRGACRSCHAEHRGVEGDLLGLDRSAFNHDRALFVLRGAHAGLDCEGCHRHVDAETGREAFRSIGVEHATCDVCHADPHSPTMRGERACSECHGESGWADSHLILAERGQGAGFAHGRDTSFALAGRHTALECRACHTLARAERERREGFPPGTGAPSACASCHDDPHRGSLKADCGSCHSPAVWKGADSPFAHDRHTSFPLDRTHGGLGCVACHEDSRFQAAGNRCGDCHLDAASLTEGRFDEVRGERRCVECHTPEYGQLLLTRRRILDELVVRGEATLRSQQLAARRGERAEDAALSRIARRVERLARSGIHNPDLAESVLRAELDRLGAR